MCVHSGVRQAQAPCVFNLFCSLLNTLYSGYVQSVNVRSHTTNVYSVSKCFDSSPYIQNLANTHTTIEEREITVTATATATATTSIIHSTHCQSRENACKIVVALLFYF